MGGRTAHRSHAYSAPQAQAYSSYVAAVALSAGDILALIMWWAAAAGMIALHSVPVCVVA